MIHGYSEGGSVRRVLMETMIAAGHSSELARPVQEAAIAIGANIASFLPPFTRPPNETQMYLLTRAVDGVIRAATYDDMLFLRDPVFEDEIVRLVEAYLSAATANG